MPMIFFISATLVCTLLHVFCTLYKLVFSTISWINLSVKTIQKYWRRVFGPSDKLNWVPVNTWRGCTRSHFLRLNIRFLLVYLELVREVGSLVDWSRATGISSSSSELAATSGFKKACAASGTFSSSSEPAVFYCFQVVSSYIISPMLSYLQKVHKALINHH